MFTPTASMSLKRRFIRVFWISILTVILGLLTSGTVFADTIGPDITVNFPADGATLNNAKVDLSITAHDQDNVDASSVELIIDDVKVRPIIQYAPIDEWTDDYTTLMIDHWVTFSGGVHNVNLSVKDKAGNSSSKTFSFTVAESTKIISQNPAKGSTVKTRVPVISVTVNPAASIDPDSIVMSLNNSPVNPAYDPFAGTITYVPSEQLLDETQYNVVLNMKDKSGNPLSASWTFNVNTYQEMPYSSNDESCLQCHDKTVHPMNNCTACHGYNESYSNPAFPLDDCYSCHFGSTNYPEDYHKEGIPAYNPPDHPVQITYSCTECHSQKWSGAVIPPTHASTELGTEHIVATNGCTSCHSTSLTREHESRLDSAGNAFTCATCHSSTDTKVQTAIKTGNGDCMACHGNGTAHPEHNNGLDQACQTCHSSSVLSDQQFHGKTGCATCHENQTNPTVNYAMEQKDTSCFACHTEGHNINFVRKIPADIPLYPGFKWAVPQDATIWAGEEWLPAEFNSVGAKLVISSRRTDVTGTEIFEWYTQNLTSKGWEKISGLAEGGEYFILAYKQGSRLLTVIVYPGASHDPGSAYAGYRVELLYK